MNPVYWYASDDHVIVNEYLEVCKKKHGCSKAILEIIDDYRSFDWNMIVELRDAQSIFDTKESIVVILNLPSDPDKSLNAAGKQVIDDWMVKSKSTVLFIRSPLYSYGVKNTTWYKQYKSIGIIHEISLTQDEIVTWIDRRAKQKDLNLTQDQIDKLIGTFSGKLDSIENELTIMSYSSHALKVLPNVSRSLSELSEELPKKSLANLIALINTYEKQAEDPMQVFSIISFFINKCFKTDIGLWNYKSGVTIRGKAAAARFYELLAVELAIKGMRGAPPWFAIREYVRRIAS
ncbi:MAG: hypothetical protein QM538_00085 [Methylacidiphilales bacterium]|nr:hypothetical protein [Candidatus Methylacidiphilales bacterium]